MYFFKQLKENAMNPNHVIILMMLIFYFYVKKALKELTKNM